MLLMWMLVSEEGLPPAPADMFILDHLQAEAWDANTNTTNTNTNTNTTNITITTWESKVTAML